MSHLVLASEGIISVQFRAQTTKKVFLSTSLVYIFSHSEPIRLPPEEELPPAEVSRQLPEEDAPQAGAGVRRLLQPLQSSGGALALQVMLSLSTPKDFSKLSGSEI